MVIAGSSDCDDRRRLAQTEIYDPSTGQFTAGPPLLNPRYKIIDATTVLPSGEVVVAGDATDVEIWTPGTPAFIKVGASIDNGLAFSSEESRVGKESVRTCSTRCVLYHKNKKK